ERGANFLFIPPFILDPGDPDRLYTGGQTLWRSNDAAVSWSEAGAAIPDSSGSISAIAVSPADSNRVLFGTSTGQIYRNPNALTADNSVTWDVVRPRSGYVAALTFDPDNPDTAYAVYSTFKTGAQNYVYKTTDGGA